MLNLESGPQNVSTRRIRVSGGRLNRYRIVPIRELAECVPTQNAGTGKPNAAVRLGLRERLL